LDVATQKLEKAKSSLNLAKSNLEKANQNYDSVISKKKEKEAALEAEILARKEKEKAEEEARKQAKIEAERKAAEEERKRAEEETRKQAKIEAERKAAEEERKRAEEEARKQAEIEAERKAAEEERKRAEEAAQRRSISAPTYREIEIDDSSDGPLYSPGNEPNAIKRRLDTLFEKLDGAYPDKVVVGLHNDHKKWGETVTELYRLLRYPDGKSFLEAYGYKYGNKELGGRTKSVDPEAIIKEFQKKYPSGSPFKSADSIQYICQRS